MSGEYLYEHEIEARDKRKKIAAALDRGWTYERIRREFGVGTSTIASVKRITKEGGEWASS